MLVNTNPDKIVVEYENVDLTHSPEQQSQVMFCSVPASQVSEVTFGQYRPITSCNKDSWVSVREWLIQLVLWHCNAPIRNETTRSFIFYFAGMKNKVNDIFTNETRAITKVDKYPSKGASFGKGGCAGWVLYIEYYDCVFPVGCIYFEMGWKI